MNGRQVGAKVPTAALRPTPVTARTTSSSVGTSHRTGADGGLVELPSLLASSHAGRVVAAGRVVSRWSSCRRWSSCCHRSGCRAGRVVPAGDAVLGGSGAGGAAGSAGCACRGWAPSTATSRSERWERGRVTGAVDVPATRPPADHPCSAPCAGRTRVSLTRTRTSAGPGRVSWTANRPVTRTGRAAGPGSR